jgi:hypothetical protein
MTSATTPPEDKDWRKLIASAEEEQRGFRKTIKKFFKRG